MIKTGYEIIGMIKDGKAPRKIRTTTANHIEYTLRQQYYYYDDIELDLIGCLNDEFEIVENHKVWKPEDGQDFWYIMDNGDIAGTCWANSKLNEIRYEMGNCYETFEEAQQSLEKIKIYAQLKRYAEKYNIGDIDWENNNVEKCFITKKTDIRIQGTYFHNQIGQIFFTSEEIAKEAIQEIGEENIEKLFN